MAFSLDDFSKFFDPVSDVLCTSGRRGVGLLQQKPEDLAMLAALAAGGFSLLPTAIPLEGAAAATTLEPAGQAATLVTTAPGITAATTDAAANEATRLAAEEAAKEAARKGILQAGINEPDMARAAANSNYLKQPPAGLENQINLINKGPGYVDYLNDTSAKSLYKANSFEEYQLDAARRAAANAAPSTVDMSLAKPTVPTYESLDTRLMPNSSIDTSQSLRSMGADSTYKLGSGDYLGEGTGEAMKNPLLKGAETAAKYFGKGIDLAKEYPFPAAGLAYYGAYKSGLLDQPGAEAPKDNYKNPYNMSGFQRSSPNPSAYQYKPRYAEGGIASIHGYAKGKRVASNPATDFTDFYDQMNARPAAPAMTHGDPGIYYDADPDTRYLDPMEASMVRMSKLNSRTNVQAPTMVPSWRMGELNFAPVAAAQGGIMGYADGGDVPIEDDEFKRLTGHGGGRTTAEPGAKFSPTSEGAAAVSKFGQGMKNYPGWAPLGLGAQVLGAIASAYGDHMARNVNPNYSNEAMNTTAGKTFDVPTINADDDNSAILGLDGNNDASVSSSDFGGGATDPAGRDASGSPLAKGGIASIHTPYNLGGYAAGGNPRLLRGPGDGMSDHIPATINDRQPARLADGEYVITADVVSHLGNGSTEAGARQLDAMMKRIRKGRTGTPKQGKQIDPRKYLPA